MLDTAKSPSRGGVFTIFSLAYLLLLPLECSRLQLLGWQSGLRPLCLLHQVLLCCPCLVTRYQSSDWWRVVFYVWGVGGGERTHLMMELTTNHGITEQSLTADQQFPVTEYLTKLCEALYLSQLLLKCRMKAVASHGDI